MGLFSNSAPRRRWPELCVRISDALAWARDNFFKACVEAAKRSGSHTAKDTLGGSAEHALMAYQYVLAAATIQQRGYIAGGDLSEFSELVYESVCGEALEECGAYVERYFSGSGDASMRLVRDVFGYVLDVPNPDAVLLISHMVDELILTFETQMATAVCFGDKKYAQQVAANLKKALHELGQKRWGSE